MHDTTRRHTDLLTTKELAEEIDVSKETLKQWRWLGKGPAFIKTGAQVRYDRRDIDAWLDANRRQTEGGIAA